jgi:hypothetical protein
MPVEGALTFLEGQTDAVVTIDVMYVTQPEAVYYFDVCLNC